MKKLLLVATIALLSACQSPLPTPSPSETPIASCVATDQDNDIYHPDRLSVKAACIRVTGTVLAKIKEGDGDFHIRVKLDDSFTYLLTDANSQQCVSGATQQICELLVVEPVCVNPVTQSDAIATCQNDSDPLTDLPVVGQHVWLEGRYVLDMDHGGWAELHPLYRWGTDGSS